MATLDLNKDTTALLIADFYAEMMGTVRHAVERGVVEKTQAVRKAARDAGILFMLLCHGVPARLCGNQRPQQDLQPA